MTKRNQLEIVGGLQTLSWGSSDEEAPLIVLMHGYGASAHDLYDLGPFLDPSKRYRWLFPQGPLHLGVNMLMAGYAWFPIDALAAQKAIEQSGGLKYAHLRPKGVDEAADRGLKFLKVAGFNPTRDCLGGFSQGSMMCIELQRKLPLPVKKLLLFSSTLVDEQGLRLDSERFKGVRVFQSHGRYDEILPFEGAEALRQCLKDSGCEVDFREFSGGHEIPLPILQACRSFLGT